MDNDPQEALLESRVVGSSAECGSKAPLVLGDGAFGVPALAIKPMWESVVELSSIRAFGDVLVRATRIDGNDRFGDSQCFPADAVMGFDIVGAVAEKPVDPQELDGLRDGGEKVGRVLAGTVAQGHRGDQVAVMMTDHRHLGKSPVALHSPGSNEKVTADVMILIPCGVDRGIGMFIDQAASSGDAENSLEQSFESVFFKSRSWAFWSVV